MVYALIVELSAVGLYLHNNLILISMNFLMETLRSRTNTIFVFPFRWLRIHIFDIFLPRYPGNDLWETKKKSSILWFVLSLSIPLYLLTVSRFAFSDKGKEIFTNLLSATAERSFQIIVSLRFIYFYYLFEAAFRILRSPLMLKHCKNVRSNHSYLPKLYFDMITLVENSAFSCNFENPHYLNVKKPVPCGFCLLVF